MMFAFTSTGRGGFWSDRASTTRGANQVFIGASDGSMGSGSLFNLEASRAAAHPPQEV